MCVAPWGGSEELWSQTATRLAKEGHSVAASIVGWPQLSSKATELSQNGIELFTRFANTPGLTARTWNWVKRKYKPVIAEEFLWVQRQQPDLVIISQGGNGDGYEWMEFCRGAGLPFAAIVQANYENWWPADEFAEGWSRAYYAARRVFCVSRENLKLLQHQLGGVLSQAEVVWNPCAVSDQSVPAWPANGNEWKIACVARLEPAAKGQDILFQVLELKQWRERPLKLSLFGNGPCKENLKRLANQLKLTCVDFRGYEPNVAEIWAEHQLLVLPSRYEGLPLALVEAMWCGRPAVVTKVGGNAEVCVDGDSGFVVPAPSVELLDESLERAWSARHKWQDMGQSARKRIQKIFPKDAIEEFAQKLLECH